MPIQFAASYSFAIAAHTYIYSPKVLVFDRHDTLIVANKPPIEQHYWRQAKQCTCLQFGLIVALKSFTVHLFVFRDSMQALEFAHVCAHLCVFFFLWVDVNMYACVYSYLEHTTKIKSLRLSLSFPYTWHTLREIITIFVNSFTTCITFGYCAAKTKTKISQLVKQLNQ